MSIIIALDGPSGSGKSTIAKLIAKKYNLVHIDSGAMYRAMTLYCLENNIDPKDEVKVCQAIPSANISFSSKGVIMLNGKDVSKEIREHRVSDTVSFVSSYKQVRLTLIELQREIGKHQSIIMDGRDIGTFVFPNADVKIYQVASAETRALRRQKQNELAGIKSNYEDVLKNIQTRDYIDSHREFDPSKKADDAIEVDTSSITIEQVVEECSKIIDKKLKELKKL
jgi:CMP/dCMP kinase